MSIETPIAVGMMLVTGRFLGWSKAGRVLVELDLGDPEPTQVEARSMAALAAADVGEEVLVQFTANSRMQPVVMGRLDPPRPTVTVEVDGEEQALVIDAQNELTLRCGKASITLTKEGKVILRGTYISSRSSGQNRIKGGSVHLN